jgi:hypothetical protein
MMEVSYDANELKKEIYLISEKYDYVCFMEVIKEIENSIFDAFIEDMEESIFIKQSSWYTGTRR